MFPSEQYVKSIKKRYPAGTRIVLDSMDDPQAVPPGTKGTVKFVDDIGSIHCHWANGRSLAVVMMVRDETCNAALRRNTVSRSTSAPAGVGASVCDSGWAAHELALSGVMSAGAAGAISEGLKSNSPNGAAKQLRSTSNFAAAASRER